MKTIRFLLALCVALPPFQSFAENMADTDRVKQDVAAATAEWVATFNTRNPARIAALYTPDAVLWGTVSPTIRTTPAEILEYFTASATRRPTLQISLGEQQVRVYGEIAFNSGYYTSRDVQDGQEIVTPMRFTFAYRKLEGRWMIVNHHSSRMPAP